MLTGEASPTVGNSLVIMPSAVQVSRLTQSLVTYTICRLLNISPVLDLPENLSMHSHCHWDQVFFV